MAKKSRERGISFTYERNKKVLHCGIKTSEEYERWNKCLNPLAPTDEDLIDNVYVLGIRRYDLDGITSNNHKLQIADPFQ